jgi:NADH:ubiquinone reductase (non-electrogenic)
MMQVVQTSRGRANVIRLGLITPRHFSQAAIKIKVAEGQEVPQKQPPKLLSRMDRVKSSLGLPKPGGKGRLPQAVDNRPKLVILGSGWAAYNTIANLGPEALKQYDVKVISKDNYFVYTPMLPSVSAGTLESESITQPIRTLIHKQARVPEASIHFNEAEALAVDPEEKLVKCKDVNPHSLGHGTEYQIPYDILVLGVGATTNTFGTPGAMENCLFLKSVADAQKIRSTVVSCFEKAAMTSNQEEIDRLLSFVMVGAGPTGVEVAAELRDWIEEDMLKHYPQFKNQEIKVQIVEMGDRVLATYDKKCSAYTQNRFDKDRIEVLTKHQVKKVNKDSIEVMDLTAQEPKTLPFGMCVWASGVRPNDVSLELAKAFGTRMLEIDASLRVKGSEGTIFALGDCAKVSLPLMKTDVNELFAEADKSNTGVLSEAEFEGMMLNASKKYSHLADMLAEGPKDTLKTLYRSNIGKAKDVYQTPGITPASLEQVLSQVDKKIKMLPPTAQVAAQQGTYLGRALTEVPHDQLAHPVGFDPHFQYDHQGSMAYVGSHCAVIESPVLGVMKGFFTGIMWKGAYWAKSVSLRSKILMAFNYAKTHLLGRDVQRF